MLVNGILCSVALIISNKDNKTEIVIYSKITGTLSQNILVILFYLQLPLYLTMKSNHIMIWLPGPYSRNGVTWVIKRASFVPYFI